MFCVCIACSMSEKTTFDQKSVQSSLLVWSTVLELLMETIIPRISLSVLIHIRITLPIFSLKRSLTLVLCLKNLTTRAWNLKVLELKSYLCECHMIATRMFWTYVIL